MTARVVYAKDHGGGLCKKTRGRDLKGRSDRKGGLCKKTTGRSLAQRGSREEVRRTRRSCGEGGPKDEEVQMKRSNGGDSGEEVQRTRRS